MERWEEERRMKNMKCEEEKYKGERENEYGDEYCS